MRSWASLSLVLSCECALRLAHASLLCFVCSPLSLSCLFIAMRLRISLVSLCLFLVLVVASDSMSASSVSNPALACPPDHLAECFAQYYPPWIVNMVWSEMHYRRVTPPPTRIETALVTVAVVASSAMALHSISLVRRYV